VKQPFNITDPALIAAMLDAIPYGVLALGGERPYAVPVNFVWLDGAIWFHSSPKGKKMRLIAAHPQVSFNVVRDELIIPSFFSSREGLACPASSFSRSVTIDGTAAIVSSREEIARAFTAMMEKLQPQGGYTAFDSAAYDAKFAAIAMVRIEVESLSAKFKFGQNLSPERFAMVLDHLEQRGSELDLLTAQSMRQFYAGE